MTDIFAAHPDLKRHWWEAHKEEILRKINFEHFDGEEIIRSRPPDEILDRPSEPHGNREVWEERRFSLFSTWPERIEVQRWGHKRTFTWNLPDGTKVGFNDWVEDPPTQDVVRRWRMT